MTDFLAEETGCENNNGHVFLHIQQMRQLEIQVVFEFT